MRRLCDLHDTKLFHIVAAGVFLNESGDGHMDGQKAFRLHVAVRRQPVPGNQREGA